MIKHDTYTDSIYFMILENFFTISLQVKLLTDNVFLSGHGGDNLVLLSGVSVVEHPEQILPGSVDGLTQQEVGEQKLVAFVVELIISILE